MIEITVEDLNKYWTEDDLGTNKRVIGEVLKCRYARAHKIKPEDIKIVVRKTHCPTCGADLPK